MTDEEIFSEAIQLSGSKRTIFLDSVCGGDCQQRERVERLIAAHESPDSYLENALPESGLADTIGLLAASKHPVIGNYKLLHKLGEGGFGVVYMAEQLKPVRRKVAIKILKADRLSDPSATVARFEAERQALAMMDHPNIATIFDGGTLPAGSGLLDQTLGAVERPFFVMELVNGVPITDYCDKNNLPMRERLELFATVCQAVHHAHQKGVIHRDLKPSNILVTLHDGHPVVKIIDFGVAKAINQQLTEKTLYTVLGDMIGRPLYMSPEQAERSGLDIDTRSDVYSLGVLLYELLTGSTPITADELKQAGLLQIQRRIVDSEPPKPSRRLSTSGEKLTIIAKHRSVSPERLHRELRGDLDWIVMKALEKDRTRRYESASSFGDDVRRFLADDFVEARPPSTWYRTTKFCKRHTALVVSTSSVIAALSVGLAVAICSYGVQLRIANELVITKGNLENQKRTLATTNIELESRKNEMEKANLSLNKAYTEINLAYEKLKDGLIEKALLFAHNGEEEKTETAIEQARLAGASEAWQEMIRAQLKLYGTNPRGAFQHLNRAIELESENRTAHAMLGVALIFDGSGEDFARELALLNSKYQPQTSFDKLFASQVYAMLVNSNETDRSTRLVREALAERMTPLGVAIEAQVLGHEALDRGSREIAKVALDKITAAHEFLPNNPFVSMIYVSVHHTAYNLDVAGIDLNRFLQVLPHNQEMRQYGLGHVVVGMCYEDLEMHNDAMEAYSHGAANSSWWYYECRNMLAAGRVEDALQLATNEPITNDSWVHSKRIEAQRVKATQGNLDVSTLLKLWAEPIVRDKSSTLVAEVLLLNGEKKRAIEIATSHNLHETFSSLSVEVMRGDISIDELVKKYQSSRITLGLSLYTVGMLCWAEGNVEAAREAFNAAVATKCFFSYGYYGAKVMLSLLDKGLLKVPLAK